MNLFSLDIPVNCVWLMSVAIFCAIILLTFYRYRIGSVKRQATRCAELPTPSIIPGVSIIVYCDGTPFGLNNMLESILMQDYDGEYEVIVVNDGSAEDVKDVFNRLAIKHNNLYLTFIPSDAHNISRRKLAITLGIKGARYDYVLVVDASSQIPSLQWLSSMTRHFAMGYDVVLGYATYKPSHDTDRGYRLRAFDTAADAVTYLSAGIAGHPYRGHGCNIGYARQLFYNVKGFSKSLNLHNGDDDIFINMIANRRNTAVELSPLSIVELNSSSPRALHRRWKWQHMFTQRRIGLFSRLLMGLYSFMFWVGTLCGLAASLLALPSIIPAIAYIVIELGLWIPVIFTWRKTLQALDSRRLCLTIPWMVMIRPFYNLYYRIVELRFRRRNYTWGY